jgi:hypothetical protein
MLCGSAGEVDEHTLAGVHLLDVARRNPDLDYKAISL